MNPLNSMSDDAHAVALANQTLIDHLKDELRKVKAAHAAALMQYQANAQQARSEAERADKAREKFESKLSVAIDALYNLYCSCTAVVPAAVSEYAQDKFIVARREAGELLFLASRIDKL